MDIPQKNRVREYKYAEVCSFRKTKERFGGLSNMASGFPVRVNGILIRTTEALYQACRFPHLPHVQKKILNEKSPMTAKMVGKPYRQNTRPDWDKVRVEVMYWCLRVKLAQNFMSFGQLLETTDDKPIVEDSKKDAFWGAVKSKTDPDGLAGVNALGRLLMKLRQDYNSAKRFNMLFVESPAIPGMLLYGEVVREIDERQTFIEGLQKQWGWDDKSEMKKGDMRKMKGQDHQNSAPVQQDAEIVAEPQTKIKKARKASPKNQKKKDTGMQPKLIYE